MYKALGKCIIKSIGDGQAIYVNGFPMGGSGTVGNYTMYVSPFMVVQNFKYTKHFYIEGQRIVSKLGEMGIEQPLLLPKSHAGDSLKNPVSWDKKKETSKDIIIANFQALGLDGAVFTAGKSGKTPYGQIKKYFRGNDVVINPGGSGSTSATSNKSEDLQFYYHPDHLGSSNYITDASGEVYQHEEYFPFGETFVEERNDAEYTTYLFNGKELDEETGLYYYGARYYDARTSVWQSVDPLAEKTPGVTVFAYTANNPVKLIDPNGMEFDDPADKDRALESQKMARAKSDEYTKIADGLSNKNNLSGDEKAKIKEYRDMANILNQHADNLDKMINSKEWKFAYNEVTDPEADLNTEYKNGVVVMDYARGEPDKQAHEETHGFQYLSGELTVNTGKDDWDSYDLNDEAKAYQVEYSMRNDEKKNRFISGIGNLKGKPIINSVNDINAENLSMSKVIKEEYPQLVRKYKKSK